MEKISFGYGHHRVLENIDAVLAENRLTALVGPSGAGKTTLTSLIARFWDPDEGCIRMGGENIAGIDPQTVLGPVAMVFQDVYLFNDTVANNIRVGRTDAGDAEIRRAARMACCHDFIAALPEGYQTVVGEGGNNLSGGEKQRISIARAILKDAPVVLLDEATASLDPENEADIQAAMANLIRGRTIVVIAHQFKSIVNAHRILVLDKGRIVQQGTHRELVGREGLYARLWDKQQQARGWTLE